MAHDAELDRLKAAQDLAYHRKQDAWEIQDQAWKRRTSAREVLDSAYEAKQRAWHIQNDAWQQKERVCSYNGPRIDSLNSQQETAYQNMVRAFDNASDAHNRRDGASARTYADEGHRYKAESQGYVTERRRLVQEIRDAKDRLYAAGPAFQQAKDHYNRAKTEHDSAKADHQRKEAVFKRAKEEFNQASRAFKARLEIAKADSKRRETDARTVAQRAGVPAMYLDDVRVSTQPDGTVNIYFGGAGQADGPGHGHYVMGRHGTVTYRREPFDPHGAQNYQRDPRVEQEMARLAMDAWARQQTTKRQIQYQDGNYTVKTGSGYSRDRDATTTDFIVAERNGSDEHYHLIIDDRGNVILANGARTTTHRSDNWPCPRLCGQGLSHILLV